MQEILVGPVRRRRWSDSEKTAIVTVAEVARRHGLSRQQICQWRTAMRQGRLVDESGGPFLAVEYVGPAVPDDERGAPQASASDPVIEVTLRKGRVLRAPASLTRSVLTALIRAAEAA